MKLLQKHESSIFFSHEEHCLSFLGLVKPRSAYQDSELEVPAAAEMTVGIIQGNHCIIYKKSKPNDMAAMWSDSSMR